MANQEEVRDVYGYFEQKGNALCYRYEAERVRIEPWGADYILVLVFCPRMTREFVDHSFSARGKDFNLFMATIYSSAVPLGIILWNLYRMIGRIGEEQIFSDENVSCLRLISWMCFAVAVICLISTAYYVFFLIIAACAAFMGLLIRVIKNVFVRAGEIKEEND